MSVLHVVVDTCSVRHVVVYTHVVVMGPIHLMDLEWGLYLWGSVLVVSIHMRYIQMWGYFTCGSTHVVLGEGCWQCLYNWGAGGYVLRGKQW